MATAPVILLPPSEGKALAGKGTKVGLSDLSFPELLAERKAIVTALVQAMKGKEDARSKLLGVKGTALAGATAANLSVMTSPTMPAIDRYTGVLYDALDVASLTARDRKRLQKQVVLFSGLWGLVRPDDMIPDYKLKMGAVLPDIGKVSLRWRRPLTEALASTVGNAIVWNLLPKEHDGAWAPETESGNRSTIPNSVFSVKFLDESAPVKGERTFTTVNHWNKLLKGALVRFILETGADDPKALTTFRHPEGYKYDRTLTSVTPSGIVLSMVRTAS